MHVMCKKQKQFRKKQTQYREDVETSQTAMQEESIKED